MDKVYKTVEISSIIVIYTRINKPKNTAFHKQISVLNLIPFHQPYLLQHIDINQHQIVVPKDTTNLPFFFHYSL